jgi:hypothetical protein
MPPFNVSDHSTPDSVVTGIILAFDKRRPGARLVDGVEAIATLLHNVGGIPTSLPYRVR